MAMYQFVTYVILQGDYNLQFKTIVLIKHQVCAEIFELEVGGMLKKNHCLCTLTPIYFEIQLCDAQLSN